MPQKDRKKIQKTLLKEPLKKKSESKLMHGQLIRSILGSLLMKMIRAVEGRSESRD
jgi:hypothetical protein